MKIGSVEIPGRTALAPMAGITGLPFRLICRELGAALVYTELISAEGLTRKNAPTQDIMETDPLDKPVAFQIFGSRPAAMARAATIACEYGADIVDINMGCPVKKVVKSGSGSGLLRDLGLAEEIIRAVIGASRVPVTVKMRTGWNADDFVAASLAKAAEEAGAAAVAVHGRYAKQGFSGHADWSAIRRVKEAVGIPVIGNGDVASGPDAKRMMDETGCDMVMVGRAMLGNPWVFREVEHYLATGEHAEPPTLAERGTMLMRHMHAVVARMGEHYGVRYMRKHAAWYSKSFEGSAEFRRTINHVETAAAFEDAASEFFLLVRK